MSTRACYIFKDSSGSYGVFKHHDGYPTGAAGFINDTLKLAWPLPRFEADEFAASFVAANKDSAGGVRLMSGASLMDCSGDIEYLYIIENKKDGINANVIVTGYSVNFWDADTEESRWAAMQVIFACPINMLTATAAKYGKE